MSNKKWDDKPFYLHEKVDVQKETGYVKPKYKDALPPIKARMNVRSEHESPLKRWWLEQERLKAQKNEG